MTAAAAQSLPRSVGLLAAATLLASLSCVRPPEFSSPRDRLEWMWEGYARHHLHADGFVVDPTRDGGMVTSEAQSYALLQSAWLGDRQTFARVLRWTQAHLRRSDGLHAWLWNPRTGLVADANTATDGDVDIAFALLLASERFADEAYATEARATIVAIRTHSAVRLTRGWLVAAGNWAVAERVVNLSYFAPYAYQRFHDVDPQGEWLEAIETGYRALELLMNRLDAPLPEDFHHVGADDTLQPLPESSQLPRHFSFDAVRVLWRTEFDCRLYRRPRACAASRRLVETLAPIARRDRGFYSAYTAAGVRISAVRSTSVYGAFLPAFTRVAPDLAEQWRRGALSDTELANIRSTDRRYYDANWAWFGLALADGLLSRPTAGPAPPAIRR